jgi:hypothetical protein
MGIGSFEHGPRRLNFVVLPDDGFQAVVLSVDPDAVEDADCAVRQDFLITRGGWL